LKRAGKNMAAKQRYCAAAKMIANEEAKEMREVSEANH